MNDFEDKLNAILSDPGAMSQIMGLARSMAGDSASQKAAGQAPEHPTSKETPREDDAGRTADLFGQLDPGLIARLLPLLTESGRTGEDERMQLLYALRPFLKPERRDKIERAAKAARLIRVGKQFLHTLGDQNV